MTQRWGRDDFGPKYFNSSRWGKARGNAEGDAEGDAEGNAEGNAPNQPTIGTNQPSIHPPVLVAIAEETEATLSGSPQLAGEFEDWWSEYGRVGDKARAFDLYRPWATFQRTSGRRASFSARLSVVCDIRKKRRPFLRIQRNPALTRRYRHTGAHRGCHMHPRAAS